jgi:Fic family protein
LAAAIASLRERIQGAAVELSWILALQKNTLSRNGHASTAIQGNPLTLEQVRALEQGREHGLRHEDVFELHHLLAARVMDQAEAGRYRTIAVRVGNHLPPPAAAVSALMFELLQWWGNPPIQLGV